MYILKEFHLAINKVRITGYLEIPDQDDPGKIGVSKEVYNYIKAHISKGWLTYNPGIQGNKLTVADITFEERNMLPEIKQGAINYIKQHTIEPFLTTEFFLISAEYFECMSLLAAEGYHVTEKNKDEMYLKIVNSGDQDLINILENLLYAKDFKKDIDAHTRKFLNAKRKINDCADEEEVADVLKETVGAVLNEVIYSNVG